jgi:hypothetical protein
MLPIKVNYVYRGRAAQAGVTSVAGWKRLLAEAWKLEARYWQREMLPKHFTVAGAAEYGYQPRQGDPGYQGHIPTYRKGPKAGQVRFWATYIGRKIGKFGHRRPLVWSGGLERAAQNIIDIRGTDRGGVAVLHVPQYTFNYRTDIPGIQPKKALELAVFSPRETEELRQYLDESLGMLIREIENDTSVSDVSWPVESGHRGVA